MKTDTRQRAIRLPGVVGLVTATLVLAAGLAVPPDAHAWNRHQPTACEQSARKMFSACRLESLEDYNVALANCANIEDRGDRSECRREARHELAEVNEECEDTYDERLGVCELLDEDFYEDPLTSAVVVDPDNISNPNRYFSLKAGDTSVFRGIEDGEQTDEIVIVRVTDEVRDIEIEEDFFAPCRVVVDAALIESEDDDEDGGWDYTLGELTDDWYAIDSVANIYYCGELSRNYDEEGVLRDLDGSFEAGIDAAKAGTLLRPMFPGHGVADRQEYALGEAEDVVIYLSGGASPDDEVDGENENDPDFACDDMCLQTRDINPNDPGEFEIKYYVQDVGFVLAAKFEGDAVEGDGEFTGEREELVCTGGDELLDADALEECGVEDGAELLEELCEAAPDAFCDDDDD